MAVALDTKLFDVGGVMLERPFKIRRLGHFGFNNVNMEESLRFYTELLGFRVSDAVDFGRRLPDQSQRASFGDCNGYFMHHGGDHHSFVMFNRRLREALDTRRTFAPGVDVNQISWQVGSLQEVVGAIPWLAEKGMSIQRSGRDWPGSNWHTYFYDPDGHTNELFYGMEQIGWLYLSKPEALRARSFQEKPPLPQISEADEVEQARQNGVDLYSGTRRPDYGGDYDVEGILLPRPFRIVRVGPVRLFVKDVDQSEAFYREIIGLSKTEEVNFEGRRCVFMRSNMEHHSMALYPIELRSQLGLKEDSTTMAFGLQVATYRQLRDAVTFLRDRGCTIRELPPELSPGISHSALVLDPDGHALQLYWHMDQVSWDGSPRPPHLRTACRMADWPETLQPEADSFGGEVFLGPLG